MKKKMLWLGASAILLMFACRKDRSAQWDARFLVPLAKTTFTLDNLFGGLTQQGTNNNVDFIYAKELYNNSPALIEIPDTGITTSFTLNSLALGDRTITRYITLGEINPLFNLLDGSTAQIPAQSQSNLDPFDIDASEFFETALLESGEMYIEFKNELPVNLRVLTFDLRNKSDGSIIASSSFNNVGPGQTASRTIDLSNKRVNASLEAKINSLETDASNGAVLIDAKKGLRIEISVRNLKAREATAAFPNQTVIQQDEELTQDFEGAELKFVKVRSGKLSLKLFTSIQEDMTLYLQIPSASKGGQFIDEVIKVKGATAGNPTVLSREIDLQGYTIDYRGKDPNTRDTVNTFYQVMRVTLDSSGRKLDVSLKDSINISYQLQSIVPDYAIGFVGTNVTETGDASVPFDVFNKISGNVSLSDLIVRLKMSNGIGAQGSVLTRNIISHNTQTGNKVTLTGPVINSDYAVSSAVFSPFIPREQMIEFNKNNSNVKSFIENLPNQLDYNMKIAISPNGNTNNWQDFIYYDSRFKIDLEMVIPGALSLDDLQFTDSVPFDIGSVQNSERIKGGTINLFYENTYPISLLVKLAVYDAQGNFLDSLGTDGKAFFAAANGSVASKGKAEIPISENQSMKLRKAKYAQLVLVANTPNNAQVQVATNQNCKVEIGADFIYELSNANNNN
jgi:hypothetical protein